MFMGIDNNKQLSNRGRPRKDPPRLVPQVVKQKRRSPIKKKLLTKLPLKDANSCEVILLESDDSTMFSDGENSDMEEEEELPKARSPSPPVITTTNSAPKDPPMPILEPDEHETGDDEENKDGPPILEPFQFIHEKKTDSKASNCEEEFDKLAVTISPVSPEEPPAICDELEKSAPVLDVPKKSKKSKKEKDHHHRSRESRKSKKKSSKKDRSPSKSSKSSKRDKSSSKSKRTRYTFDDILGGEDMEKQRKKAREYEGIKIKIPKESLKKGGSNSVKSKDIFFCDKPRAVFPGASKLTKLNKFWLPGQNQEKTAAAPTPPARPSSAQDQNVNKNVNNSNSLPTPPLKPVVATKAAVKEIINIPLHMSASTPSTKTMLDVLKSTKTRARPGRKGRKKGSRKSQSEERPAPPAVKSNGILDQQNGSSPDNAGAAFSPRSNASSNSDKKSSNGKGKSKKSTSTTKKVGGVVLNVWKSKHKNVIDPVFLGYVEHLIQDMASVQIETSKVSRDYWPDRPSSSMPSIFKKKRFTLPKTSGGPEKAKRGRPKKSDSTDSKNKEKEEQRLPLKKRHHHHIPSKPTSENGPGGSRRSSTGGRNSRKSSIDTTGDSNSSGGKKSSKKSGNVPSSLATQQYPPPADPPGSSSGRKASIEHQSPTKPLPPGGARTPPVNTGNIVDSIAACVDKYTEGPPVLSKSSKSSKSESKQKDYSKPLTVNTNTSTSNSSNSKNYSLGSPRKRHLLKMQNESPEITKVEASGKNQDVPMPMLEKSADIASKPMITQPKALEEEAPPLLSPFDDNPPQIEKSNEPVKPAPSGKSKQTKSKVSSEKGNKKAAAPEVDPSAKDKSKDSTADDDVEDVIPTFIVKPKILKVNASGSSKKESSFLKCSVRVRKLSNSITNKHAKQQPDAEPETTSTKNPEKEPEADPVEKPEVVSEAPLLTSESTEKSAEVEEKETVEETQIENPVPAPENPSDPEVIKEVQDIAPSAMDSENEALVKKRKRKKRRTNKTGFPAAKKKKKTTVVVSNNNSKELDPKAKPSKKRGRKPKKLIKELQAPMRASPRILSSSETGKSPASSRPDSRSSNITLTESIMPAPTLAQESSDPTAAVIPIPAPVSCKRPGSRLSDVSESLPEKRPRFSSSEDNDVDCLELLPELDCQSDSNSTIFDGSSETEKVSTKGRKRRKGSILVAKKNYLVAGLFSDYYKEEEDDTQPGSSSGSIVGESSSSSNKSAPLLPPPFYCGRALRAKREDFQLPFDLWWQSVNNQLPGKGDAVIASWNYKKVKNNVYFDIKPMASRFDMQACHCIADQGCREECINRMTYTECDPSLCPLPEDKCDNRRIQKKSNCKMERYMTKEGKGWGMKTKNDINAGDFIMEYVGEVVSDKEFKFRMLTEYVDDTHHYCLHLDGSTVIDGHRMGNECRFVNHSCEPNCEMQKWNVNGMYRMALFALREIQAGEELTYDYNFSLFNPHEGQTCKCGSADCRGVIGGKTQRINGILSSGSAGGDDNNGKKEKKDGRKSKAGGSAVKRVDSGKALNLLEPIKPMTPSQKDFVIEQRCFLIRNFEKVRRLRDNLSQKMSNLMSNEEGAAGSEKDSAKLIPEEMIKTGITALTTARSMQTRRLTIAQDDPNVTKVVKLAQILREIFAQVTSITDDKGRPLSRHFNSLPSKRKHPLYQTLVGGGEIQLDFNSIDRSINTGSYATPDAFDKDMIGLFQNNMRYFGRQSEEGQAAAKLRELYHDIRPEYASTLEEIVGPDGGLLAFKTAKKAEQNSKDDAIECPCGQFKDEGLMVQCETCQVWQHCDCVGGKDEEAYHCPKCSGKPPSLDIKMVPQPEYASPGETYYVSLMRDDLQTRVGDTVYVLRAFKDQDGFDSPKSVKELAKESRKKTKKSKAEKPTETPAPPPPPATVVEASESPMEVGKEESKEQTGNKEEQPSAPDPDPGPEQVETQQPPAPTEPEVEGKDKANFNQGGIMHKMMSPTKGPSQEASSLSKVNYPTYKSVDARTITTEDMDIFRIERLWINENGERFAFGHHYLRPHETFHEPSRKFFHNEVFRVPIYEV